MWRLFFVFSELCFIYSSLRFLAIVRHALCVILLRANGDDPVLSLVGTLRRQPVSAVISSIIYKKRVFFLEVSFIF